MEIKSLTHFKRKYCFESWKNLKMSATFTQRQKTKFRIAAKLVKRITFSTVLKIRNPFESKLTHYI